MKQQWTSEELFASWMLTDTEKTLINKYHTDPNQLVFGTLFKCFQNEGRFPQRKQDIPPVILEHIGQQLHVPNSAIDFYNWTGRTTKRQRVHIRQFFGFRTGTVADVTEMTAWLSLHPLLDEDRQFDRLKEIVYERYRELKIEPPPLGSVERIIRSAVRSADTRLYTKVLEKLSPEIQTQLDTLLGENMSPGDTSLLFDLKSEAGAATLENVLAEIAKLERIRALWVSA